MFSNVIGRDIRVIFDFVGDKVPSKIDTGAETNSIHCGENFIKDNILYCDILETGNLVPFNEYKIKNVRSSNGNESKRYCVNLNFIMDGKEYNSDFTLNNRSLMKYPVLLGKNFLSSNSFMVDVNKSINEMIINRTIKKILKEENEKSNLYNKIAQSLIPPFIYDIQNNFDLSEDDIIPIIEIVLNQKISLINSKFGDGEQTYLFNKNGDFIYFESVNGDDWVIRKFDDKGVFIGYIDEEGEYYIDENGNEVKL